MLDIALTVFAYLLGSISTGIITSKVMGLPDPRNQGSGNPGATNVLRLGGKKAAAITLLGDMLKGLIPVLVARALGAEDHILAAVGLAAFLGHLYPIFFGFHGGKGVATALGVLLGISWPVGLAVIGIWLLMAKLFKISSLSAISAAVMTPLFMWRLEESAVFLTLAILLAILLVWRHRSNIKRLLEGSEGKIQQ